MAGRLQRYARIKNGVLELLASGVLTKRELQIVLLVIRESWGWNKGASNYTHRTLTLADIAKRTGIHKAHVSRTLRGLVEKQIIIVQGDNSQTRMGFNEHKDQWVPKEQHSSKDQIQKGNNLDPKRQQPRSKKATSTHCKRASDAGLRDPKERSKERSKEKRVGDDEMAYSAQARQTVQALKDELTRRGATIFERDWHLKSLAVAESLLKRLTPEALSACMKWAFADPFWGSRIDSMSTIQRAAKQWQMSSEDAPSPRAALVKQQAEDELNRAWGDT